MEKIAEEVKLVEVEEEMKRSYIDYAMSVIVGRALPDARDGLKPVHRRILYAMYDMGMYPGRPYKKCARIVGEVLGKYHPHGDMAVYDALVRMAQDFSSRHVLIDGHGNFGSIDGDSAAAMRYTEARLSPLAMELLRDIEKETVEFVPNFDESLKEPQVLPARFPNLLVNGSSGIAVGMATNIPPHNLREVIEAVVYLIDNPNATLPEILKIIKGPDFPTGGLILGKKSLAKVYETGRGPVKVRARAVIEEGDKPRIVVTEIPFQVNKSSLAAKIAELAREKKIPEITDLRDESDREGLRLVIELKKDCIPQIVLNRLYKHTQLEVAFGVNILALVDGVPRTLSLLDALQHYLNYQEEVVRRRTEFDLKKAKERLHLTEGLLIALENLDEVIELIKNSLDPAEARERLMKRFALSPEQAQAILDMKLQRLTQLEREKLEEEATALREKIIELQSILDSREKLLGVVKEELVELKNKYGEPRRTKIVAQAEELTVEDLVSDDEVIVTLSSLGYVKRLPLDTYRVQKRGGKGVLGTNLKEGDYIRRVLIARNHDYLLLFSNRGRVYRLKVYEVPEASRQARGQAVVNLIPLSAEERIIDLVAVREFENDKNLVFSTSKGLVKKTPLVAYDCSRRSGLQAIALRAGDELVGVTLTTGKEKLALFTREGQAIVFKEENVRAMGRVAAGVRGIKLKNPADRVVDFERVRLGEEVLLITENGYGKRTSWQEFPTYRRGGMGVRALKIDERRGFLALARGIESGSELIIATASGQIIKLNSKGIPRMKRAAYGVKVVQVSQEDHVVALGKA